MQMAGLFEISVYITPQTYSLTSTSFTKLPIVNTMEEECLETSKLCKLCFNFKGNAFCQPLSILEIHQPLMRLTRFKVLAKVPLPFCVA